MAAAPVAVRFGDVAASALVPIGAVAAQDVAVLGVAMAQRDDAEILEIWGILARHDVSKQRFAAW